MGGRGSSSSTGWVKTAKNKIATRVTVQNGGTITLTSPLEYGEPAKMSAEQRTVINDFEREHLNSTIEYDMLVDADGYAFHEGEGGRDSVSTPEWAMSQAEIYTHNHPRGPGEEGALGGTFSQSDVETFANYPKLKTFRASAYEGTYSITKGEGFDAEKTKSFFKAEYNKAEAIRNLMNADAKRRLKKGYITYERYENLRISNFNDMMVSLHNSLLKGQKEYGYTYTLEERVK